MDQVTWRRRRTVDGDVPEVSDFDWLSLILASEVGLAPFFHNDQEMKSDEKKEGNVGSH